MSRTKISRSKIDVGPVCADTVIMVVSAFRRHNWMHHFFEETKYVHSIPNSHARRLPLLQTTPFLSNNSQLGDATHSMQNAKVQPQEEIYEVHLLVSIQLTNWPTRV